MFKTLIALSLTAIATAEICPPLEPAAPCYPDDCAPCPRCLGPENFSGNPPVCPMTCGGDYTFTAALLYWNAHQDGMEFAIDNWVTNPNANLPTGTAPTGGAIQQLNQLVDAGHKLPHSKFRWGFKLGLGYCNPCDGWDLSLLWTRFHGKASSDVEADITDNRTLLPLWSQFVSSQGSLIYATRAEDHWKVKLNLVDFELGRNYWVSKYLSMRPFVGIRYASIKQHTEIEYRGGSWSSITTGDSTQPALNSIVDLQNDYRGAGLRAGIDSKWNFGCGWAIYGDLAASIIYGRFHINHNEDIRQATNPHTIVNILDTEESLRAARAMLDLALGVQWQAMFCDCQYVFTAMLGWEQHLFFNQNQMWRANRVGATAQTIAVNPAVLNLTGQNVFDQKRGSLDTQGWTLAFRFDF